MERERLLEIAQTSKIYPGQKPKDCTTYCIEFVLAGLHRIVSSNWRLRRLDVVEEQIVKECCLSSSTSYIHESCPRDPAYQPPAEPHVELSNLVCPPHINKHSKKKPTKPTNPSHTNMAETPFSLRNRALKLNTAADLTPHISALESSTNSITSLDLSGNTIGVEAAAALATHLSTQTALTSANLADIFTGRLLAEIPEALSSLLGALLKCPRLETVNLNDNAFGLNTVEPLRVFLSQHTPLRHLYLNNNGLGPAAGTLIANALTALADRKTEARQAGKDVPDLETVVCGRNRLENGSMAAWVKTFRANNSVKVVKMVQNGIRPPGISALLGEGLANCEGLRVLDLQDNTFTLPASRVLAAVLSKWSGLTELAVGDCLLGSRGGKLVGEALGKGGNKGLEVLRLQFNELDAGAVRAFCEAAKGLGRLRRVELNGNKFSEDDPHVEALQSLLSDRKAKAAESYPDVDEDDEEAWGIDELDELEEDDEDEDEDEDEAGGEDAEDEDEIEAEEEKILKEADEAEAEPVSEKKDREVDDLADVLGKTEIK
ncbi:Ran GAP Rna1 [Elasticomyces elasticus]|nr:Ran GAP Rna1 [Elasticomyces elasticus]